MFNFLLANATAFLFGIYCVVGCKYSTFFKDAGPIVETNYGTVVGKYVKVFDTEVAAFLGIPFSKPPIGGKRFSKPEPVDAWKGIRMADQKPPPCMQFSARNLSFISDAQPSENCLYLNVWTPSHRCCDDSKKLPVLVWIHGGAFSFGSSDVETYDGRILASYGEAVVVTFNYRIGIFGFLNLGHDRASGNAGLHDQTMALKWVKDNIHQFGGDPNGITIFGESAGAISGSLHLISPLSRNLFARAILMSGSAYNPHITDTVDVGRYKANLISKLVGCSKEDSDVVSNPSGVIGCLQGMDALDLAKVENGFTAKTLSLFMPSIGDDFMPKPPVTAIEDGDLAPVDIMLGGVRDEGTFFLSYLVPDLFPEDGVPKLTLQAAKPLIMQLFNTLPEPIRESIHNVYMKDVSEDDNMTIVEEVSNSLGDYIFNCPMQFLAEKAATPYVYWVTHRSLRDSHAEWMGVQHFSEVPYVFGVPIEDTKNFTPEDGKFSGDLIQKWVNFARNGNPMNVDSKQVWKQFSASQPNVFELNPRNSDNIPFPRKQACEFWRSIFASSSVAQSPHLVEIEE